MKYYLFMAVLVLVCCASAAPVRNEEPSKKKPLTNSIDMTFIRVPSGSFLYGGPKKTKRPILWGPRFQVKIKLTKDFYLGQTEVTQAQFEKVMGTNPSHFKDPQHPVDSVTYHEAVAFCKKLSELPKEKAAGRTYSLPSSAEWEYASRAGSEHIFPWGNEDETILGEFAWCRDFYGPKAKTTHPVGKKKPNAWALHDMLGNVWEWCSDATWHNSMHVGTYYFKNEEWVDPKYPNAGQPRHTFVIRGGGWRSDFRTANCWLVTGQRPKFRDNDTGFRVKCMVDGRR